MPLSRERSASRREGDAASDARHWALRMIYVQLALVYFWTGFTKVDPVWLTGDTLHQLTASAENQALINSLADTLGVSHGHIHAWASWAVMMRAEAATARLRWTMSSSPRGSRPWSWSRAARS